jgi:acetyl esterase/lipase
LVNYVWIPSSYKAGNSPLLPLLIDIHGGGFSIGHPTADDSDNAILCHKHGICVVSINYRKAPRNPFPIPAQDAAALIQAVLDDPDLPVDKTKVAVAGYSAGGTLSLTATQLNSLFDRVKGVVAYYPTTEPGREIQKRIDSCVLPPNGNDILKALSPAFNWSYLPLDHDLHDPLLAPLYADRAALPQKLFIIGCEYDMLCAEAREMAERLAKVEDSTATKEPLGQGRTGWKCGNVTWEELKGMEHGFNQRRLYVRNEEVRKLWESKTEEMHTHVAEWLFREVYS